MAINQVLLEGKVATTPKPGGVAGGVSFRFVIARRTLRAGGAERFAVEVHVSRLCDLRIRKGDDVLVLGHLEEDREGTPSAGARRREHPSVIIAAVAVRRLPFPEADPPTVLIDELPEAFGGDEIPF
ncbi:MAG: hypothetical protein JW820_18180 [Spirochaetales bacterium]|nr:hypothetical protein [Spirochaetales bacterium]